MTTMDLMDEDSLVLELREGVPVVLGLPQGPPPLYGAWDGKVYELIGP